MGQVHVASPSRSYPALAEKKHSRGESDELRVEEESSNLMAEEGKEKEALPERSALAPLKSTCEGWKDYFQHSVRYAGIGLALLYMTVLGFDNITYGERWCRRCRRKNDAIKQIKFIP